MARRSTWHPSDVSFCGRGRKRSFDHERELKQDLRWGAGLCVVLQGLHLCAYQVFQSCANVQEVVQRIQANPGSVVGAVPATASSGGTADENTDAVDDKASCATVPANGVDMDISIGILLTL